MKLNYEATKSLVCTFVVPEASFSPSYRAQSHSGVLGRDTGASSDLRPLADTWNAGEKFRFELADGMVGDIFPKAHLTFSYN